MQNVNYKRWPASKAIATALQIVAWIVAALALVQTAFFLLLALFSLIAGAGAQVGGTGVAGGILGALIFTVIGIVAALPYAVIFVLCFALAEHLLILVAIEENTLATATNTFVLAQIAKASAPVPSSVKP